MTHDATTRDATTRPHAATDAPLTAVAPADELRTVLDAVAVLVDECVLRFDEGALSVDAMDPATVGLVSLSLSADAFAAYDAAGARLGVDLERLRDVVGMADRGQQVRLAFEAETRRLGVRVGELSYSLALVDPDAIRSPPEDIDLEDQFAATVTVAGGEFSRAVEAAAMVSDHLELGVDEDERRLYARADGDTDSAALELPADDCREFDPGPAHSLFSLRYLADVDRAVPTDRPVDLRLGEEAPVELTFDVAGGDGTVRYVISPRLTTN